jgi:hypothetical protein
MDGGELSRVRALDRYSLGHAERFSDVAGDHERRACFPTRQQRFPNSCIRRTHDRVFPARRILSVFTGASTARPPFSIRYQRCGRGRRRLAAADGTSQQSPATAPRRRPRPPPRRQRRRRRRRWDAHILADADAPAPAPCGAIAPDGTQPGPVADHELPRPTILPSQAQFANAGPRRVVALSAPQAQAAVCAVPWPGTTGHAPGRACCCCFGLVGAFAARETAAKDYPVVSPSFAFRPSRYHLSPGFRIIIGVGVACVPKMLFNN